MPAAGGGRYPVGGRPRLPGPLAQLGEHVAAVDDAGQTPLGGQLAVAVEMAKVLQDLKAEYEAGETIEARVARDADKLETLLQAVEYQTQGHDTAAWQETSIDALRTDSAKQLAQALSSADPHGWWSAFAKSYRELRASAQERARRLEARGNGEA